MMQPVSSLRSFRPHSYAMLTIPDARAVFEKMVDRLTQNPDTVARAKPLFVFFHSYESQFGELAQIVKLEKRMGDLFPEDPLLLRFAQRFSTTSFDPTTIRPIVSAKAQMRPANLPNIVPTVEAPPAPPPQQQQVQELQAPPAAIHSPHLAPALLPVSHSPKRSFDEVDSDLTQQPRKMMRSERGESPLKGAAGRRLDAARRNMQGSHGGNNMPVTQMPQPLPREINFLLGIIPGAHAYKETRFSAEKLVAVLHSVDIARAQVQPQNPTQPPMQQVPPPHQMGWGGQQGMPQGLPPQHMQQQGMYSSILPPEINLTDMLYRLLSLILSSPDIPLLLTSSQILWDTSL
jgi:cleavage stimulation factor subunit 3